MSQNLEPNLLSDVHDGDGDDDDADDVDGGGKVRVMMVVQLLVSRYLIQILTIRNCLN